MLSFIRRNKYLLAAVLVLAAVGGAVALFLWKRQAQLPGPGDPTYEQYVEAFELGVAALDVDVPNVAEENLNRAIELPVAERRNFIEGFPREEFLRDPFSRRNLQSYIFQTGQPAEVREAFLAAMGFNAAEFSPPEDLFDPLKPR